MLSVRWWLCNTAAPKRPKCICLTEVDTSYKSSPMPFDRYVGHAIIASQTLLRDHIVWIAGWEGPLEFVLTLTIALLSARGRQPCNHVARPHTSGTAKTPSALAQRR